MMALRVLLVDRWLDAERVAAELSRCLSGVSCCRVESEADLRRALDESLWDVVLTEWCLPQLPGPTVIALARELQPDVPLVVVTGDVSEDSAVEAMRAGADDWVHKERLGRLPRALERAIDDGELRAVRRATDDHMRRTDALLRAVVGCTQELITVTSADGHLLYVNPLVRELFGVEALDLVGRPVEELVHHDDRSVVKNALATLQPGRSTEIELRVTTRQGALLWLRGPITNLLDEPEVGGVVGNFRDVTERKRAETELVESEARYRALFEESPTPKWMFDPQTLRFVAVNRAAVEHYGYSREEFLAMSVLDIRPSAEVDAARASMESIDVHRSSFGRWHHRKKDGTLIEVEVSAQRLPDGKRLVVAKDVTESNRAEAELRASNARFQRLYESGVVAIAFIDSDGQVEDGNDAFLRLLGYSRDDLQRGLVKRDGVLPHDMQQLLVNAHPGMRDNGFPPFELELERKDGTRVPVLLGVAALDDGQWLSFLIDRSDRDRARVSDERFRKTEEQLRQAQKMEAVGLLAGGVAHDFNNLLSVIMSCAELIKEDMSPADPAHTDLDEITRAGRRASDLTRQLLAFSRQQVLQPRVLDLGDVVNGLHRMLSRLIGEDIELATVTGPGQVEVDPGQIEQVIMNLAVNARDAMPEGGKLTIETGLVDVDEGFAALHVGMQPGPHVLLAVSDTGVGMDAETRARIFEPFFTTKEKGRGTGLGLSTVFGIVQQSHGTVWCYSEPGVGTSFKIYLPRSDRAQDQVAARRATAPDLRGTETVLLVEDEEHVRSVVRTILRRAGYQVLEGQSGGDALLLCEQHTGRIDLILTDIIMPRMSGVQLAERLKQVRPDARVLFMSGYTDNAVVRHGILPSEMAFLQKPVTPEALLQKVRLVLGAPATLSTADARNP